MIKRAIFGAIYVAVIVAGILSGEFIFLLLLLLLGTLAVNEFLTMVNPHSDDPADRSVDALLRSFDCVGAAIMIVTLWTGLIMWNGQIFWPGIVTYIMYIFMRLVVQLWIRNQNPLSSVAYSMMSQLYIALPIGLMAIIYRMHYNPNMPYLLLMLFVLVWFNDTFAYLSGRMFGRHKLWERISPKKTWEGFWGGTLMTVLAAAVCGRFAAGMFPGMNVLTMAGLGLTVAVAGTLGDLVESLIKRTVKVKDSGNLIPGHGGILDRIDSILLVIPAALVFLTFVHV